MSAGDDADVIQEIITLGIVHKKLEISIQNLDKLNDLELKTLFNISIQLQINNKPFEDILKEFSFDSINPEA